MKPFKTFFDTPQELFIGAMLQFPLVFMVHWWVFPIMAVSGIFWRLGGMERGIPIARKLGVALLTCGATYLVTKDWGIFISSPFMVWANPMSYGKESWLYKAFMAVFEGNTDKSDIASRCLGYAWFWGAYLLGLTFRF